MRRDKTTKQETLNIASSNKYLKYADDVPGIVPEAGVEGARKNDPGRGNSKCNGPGARTRLSIFRNSKEAIVAGRVTKVRRLGT